MVKQSSFPVIFVTALIIILFGIVVALVCYSSRINPNQRGILPMVTVETK
jgi:hypothetical protein